MADGGIRAHGFWGHKTSKKLIPNCRTVLTPKNCSYFRYHIVFEMVLRREKLPRMDPKVVQNQSKGHAETRPQKDHQKVHICHCLQPPSGPFKNMVENRLGKHSFSCFTAFSLLFPWELRTWWSKRHPKWKPTGT